MRKQGTSVGSTLGAWVGSNQSCCGSSELETGVEVHLQKGRQREMDPWESVPSAGIPLQQVSRGSVRGVACSNDAESPHTGQPGTESR